MRSVFEHASPGESRKRNSTESASAVRLSRRRKLDTATIVMHPQASIAELVAKMRLLIVQPLFLVEITALLYNAFAWTFKDYPNLRDPRCLGLEGVGQVCDPGNFISSRRDRKALEEFLEQIRLESPCDCPRLSICQNASEGYVISVAILNELQPLDPRQKVDETVLAHFADSLRVRWNQGQCDNDVLIVYCVACKQVHLSHGLDTEARISKHIRRDMQLEANKLLSESGGGGNYSVVFDFLLHRYYQFFVDLNASATGHGATVITSHSLARAAPDDGMSFGVKAVIILVAILSILWIACVFYLLFITFKRHKQASSGSLEAQRIREGLTRSGPLTFSPTWLWTPPAQSSPDATIKIAPAEMDVMKNRMAYGNYDRIDSPCGGRCGPQKFVTFEAPPPWKDENGSATELRLIDEPPRSAGIHKAKRVRRLAREAAALERRTGQRPSLARIGMMQPFTDIVFPVPVPSVRHLDRIAEATEDQSAKGGDFVTKL